MAKGKTFKGFSDEQMKRIAGKLGFDGPVAKFTEFLKSNPAMAAKYAGLEAKAKMKFAEGGDVPDPNQPPPISGIGEETAERMQSPTIPEGGAYIPATVTKTDEQDITAGTGQVADDGQQVETTSTTTKTVEDPTTMTAAQIEAKKAEEAVRKETEANKAVKGEVGEKSLVDAETMDPLSTQAGSVPAAQIKDAVQVKTPKSRTLESGELVEATANADKAAAFAEEVQAATANPTAAATVKGQLNDLMSDFDDGQTPAWAAGALRNATAQMAARGLGASSMAGQALVQAAMESALPIAQADAQTQATFQLQNLSNRQARAMLAAEQRAQFIGQEFDQQFQARVANAAKISDIANMNFTAEQQIALENARLAQTVDLANLDNRQAMALAESAQIASLETQNLGNRQQAAVQNAQAFLQTDLANLSNEQQTTLFNAQSNIQALLSDQAAENSAKQFNATSQNQVDQFFAGLATQVKQFNATQTNAMTQFDVTNATDVAKFNSAMKDMREQFNANNQLVIAQSNAQWRKEIATIDNASTNAANEFNAKSLLDISNQAYDNLWQQFEDVIEYAWKSGENERDRINEIVRTQITADGTVKASELTADAESSSSFGAFFANALFGPGGMMSRL
jgi:hypothetical protein